MPNVEEIAARHPVGLPALHVGLAAGLFVDAQLFAAVALDPGRTSAVLSVALAGMALLVAAAAGSGWRLPGRRSVGVLVLYALASAAVSGATAPLEEGYVKAMSPGGTILGTIQLQIFVAVISYFLANAFFDWLHGKRHPSAPGN